MSPKAAKIGIYGLWLISVPCTIFPFWVVLTLINAITVEQPLIHIDTAAFYLLVMSVFWPMAAIEFIGSGSPNSRGTIERWLLNHAGITITAWFVISLTISSVSSLITPTIISQFDYVACTNPDSVSRKGRGENLVFSLGPCTSLKQQ